MAKEYFYKAYRIFKKICGKEHLYTIEILHDIASLLYFEKEFLKAFTIYKTTYTVYYRFLGKENSKTTKALYNCTMAIIMMKKHSNVINCKTLDVRSHNVEALVIMKLYAELIDYLKNPFVIIGEKQLFLLLNYDKHTMDAPKVILSIKGSSVGKIVKIMKSKNVPIIRNCVLAKKMIEDCLQFRYIPKKYWKDVAKILKNNNDLSKKT